MASVAQQTPATTQNPVVVGNAFVVQYYHILYNSREHVHKFYQDISKIGRANKNGVMSVTTTLNAINKKILSLDYGDFNVAEITTVDSQESYNGGVLVVVSGYFVLKDNLKKRFTQTFFLAPQENGYFVLNDIFRLVDEEPENQGRECFTGSGSEASLPPRQDPASIQEIQISEQSATLSMKASDKKVSVVEEVPVPVVINDEVPGHEVVGEDVPVPEVIDEEVLMPEVVKEALDGSPRVDESNLRIEDVPKNSYASIVMKEKATPVFASEPPPKPVTKSQDKQESSEPPPAIVSETVAPVTNAAETGNNPDVAGPSIYVRGLPPNATPTSLENVFKQFGVIRDGGIQVKQLKGFAFGFVEFEEAGAVQQALEASPIMIGGRRAVVEEKRSTLRGNRGKSSSGYGSVYRGGRGNYSGGRGYGHGDYGNRGGNRGGFASRGGDGYQRAEGGGRLNRGGAVPDNASAKDTAPGTPAST